MTVSLTNTEFVTGLFTLLAVGVGAGLVLVGVAVAWIILDYREDRRYLPRHADTETWPALLPAPRTPWDRPHPGYDVHPLTAAELQVMALLWAVQRAELLHNVPHLQPSWVAETAALCAREAGMLGVRAAEMAHLARGQRDGVRAAAAVEPGRGRVGPDPRGAGRTDDTGGSAAQPWRILAGHAGRKERGT